MTELKYLLGEGGAYAGVDIVGGMKAMTMRGEKNDGWPLHEEEGSRR